MNRAKAAEDDFFAQQEADKRWAEARANEGRAARAQKLEQARIAALPRAPEPTRPGLLHRILTALRRSKR